MPVRESHIERQFVQTVRARGGMAIKLVPTIAGIPDRLILLPPGRFYLVELKTLTGTLRAIQVHRHKEMRAMGFEIIVARGEQELMDWLDTVTLL